MLISFGPGEIGRDIRVKIERVGDNYTYDVGLDTFTASLTYTSLTASHKLYTRNVATDTWADGLYRITYYDFFSSIYNAMQEEDVSILDGSLVPLGMHHATYHADISFISKTGAAEGLYLVTFFKNANRIGSASIVTPTISVRSSSGSLIVNNQALTLVTGTDTYGYASSGAGYQLAGDLYVVTVNCLYIAGTNSLGNIEIPVSYTWNIGRDV